MNQMNERERRRNDDEERRERSDRKQWNVERKEGRKREVREMTPWIGNKR